ncbi:MAG: polyprenyl synthetase family protein [Firmicutes bacterium]|nr:polyprenyl synthetase family protein [Bacillota bacterium]
MSEADDRPCSDFFSLDKTREYQKLITEAMEEALPPEDRFPPAIHQAVRYSVMGGGKRLRPLLVLAAAEAVGGNPRLVLPAAAAIEFIHTYSLVHDDLPAMDNDDFRRGIPTSHKVFGEAIAILAGDALLTYAFEVLTRISDLPGGPPALEVIRVIREVAQAAGMDGMIGGQVVDIQSEGKQIGPQTLDYMHRHKTGALIRASIRTGAILSGADLEQLDRLTDYSENFGLAFQIMDDILDVIGDESVIGKPVGSDQRNQKSTFVSQWGIEEAKKRAAGYSRRAVDSLAGFGPRGEYLGSLARYVIERKN